LSGCTGCHALVGVILMCELCWLVLSYIAGIVAALRHSVGDMQRRERAS